jgi:hypothetical protein
MKLKPLGANQTELETHNSLILFSYKTPVACSIFGQGFFVTEKSWSPTTSKHIKNWLEGRNATPRPQAFFDDLAQRA